MGTLQPASTSSATRLRRRHVRESSLAKSDAGSSSRSSARDVCVVEANGNETGAPRRTWSDFSTRLLAAVVMISSIIFLVWAGHIAVSALVLVLECITFSEVVGLGAKSAHEKRMPWFRTITWGFFISTIYFAYGKSVLGHFNERNHEFMEHPTMQFFLRHHSFLSFCIYMTFFVAFVLSLRSKRSKYQFSMYAKAHIAILTIVLQANFMMLNVKLGMIWWFFPVVCVAMNDSFSYIFGRMFGRTPLTELSPKKTWEGFMLGGLTTMLTGFFVSRMLSRWEFMTCPKPVFHDCDFICRAYCTPLPVFIPHTVTLPKMLGSFSFTFANIQWHGLVIAFFASVLGPFGGFFASGAKRAFNVKDFGSIIPGHGGIIDRVDCHLLMAAFTYVYVINFVLKRSPDVEKLLGLVGDLTNVEQIELYQELTKMLAQRSVNMTDVISTVLEL